MLLRRIFFSETEVTSIQMPHCFLAGRAGAVRFKNKFGDYTFGVQYSSPVGGKPKVKAMQVKGNIELNKWSQAFLAGLPTRTLPVFGGDFNTRFGLDTAGDTWEHGVGQFNLGKVARGNESWQQFLCTHRLGITNTYSNQVRSTFYHHSGHSPMTDYLLLPDEFSPLANVPYRATLFLICL